MSRFLARRYLIVAVAAASVLYGIAVLYTVWLRQDLGLHCLFADEPPAGMTNAGPMVGLVDREAQIIGPSPRPGDYLVRVGGVAVPNYMHFKQRVAALNPPAFLPSNARLANPADLYSPARHTSTQAEDLGGEWQLRTDLPPVVEIQGQRWVQVELVRPTITPALVGAAGGAEPQRIVTWLKLKRTPTVQLLRSLAWFQVALIILATGAIVTLSRPGDTAASLFFALCGVQFLTFMGAFHWPSLVVTRWLLWPFVVAALLLAPLMLHFYFVFPRVWPIFERHRGWIVAALHALPAIWTVLMFATMLQIRSSVATPGSLQSLDLHHRLTTLIYSYLAASVVMFVIGQALVVVAFLRSKSLEERAEVRWIVGALLAASLPIGGLLYLASADRAAFAYGPAARWMIFALSLLFIISHAVSITRYKLVPLGKLINRGMVYVGISFGVTAIFCLMVGILTTLVGQYFFRWENAVAAGLTAMIVVVVLAGIRDRLQRAVDRRFHRQRYQLDRAMQRLSEAVDRLVEPSDLARQMLQSALDAVGAPRGAVLLREEAKGAFDLAVSIGPWATLSLADEAPLCAALRGDSLLASRAATAARTWQRQLDGLGASLAFALEFDGQLLGVVLLGAKPDGAGYSDEDCTFLMALARTTALALQSAQGRRTIETLKERLADKVDKIAEQQQRIHVLQGELLAAPEANRAAAGADVESPAPADQLKHDIRGASPVVREMLAHVAKIAQSSSSVLIRGESGTGKELLAQAIHNNSARAGGPFIAVHCAAFNPGVLESELFGHVKGAFTGAERDKAGRFELAAKGTLLLDEIGDINLETQTKLLRVLQQRTFERVGGTQTIFADVRLIAATHRPLEQLIRRGTFREDLFYRLNVISLWCPPLRERREDVFELALHFLRVYAGRAGKSIVRIDDEAIEALHAFDWPGNIRQLENAIERAVVLADGDAIRLIDLPPELHEATPARAPRRGRNRIAAALAPSVVAPPAMTGSGGDFSWADTLSSEVEAHQRGRIEAALAACAGNKSQAARMLGIPRSTLFSKLRRLGIE